MIENGKNSEKKSQEVARMALEKIASRTSASYVPAIATLKATKELEMPKVAKKDEIMG